jgi:hypothetical protein
MVPVEADFALENLSQGNLTNALSVRFPFLAPGTDPAVQNGSTSLLKESLEI